MINNSTKALKEWAITVKALDEGKQIIVLRKGGVHEENKEFRVEHDGFLLYPTYEHQREDLIKEEFRSNLKMVLQDRDGNNVTIQNWAMVSDVARITEPEKLEALSPYHIWTADYARERLNWRPRKPLHVLLLRVFRLSQPKTIDMLPEYGGYKSWIGLVGEQCRFEEAKPVLEEEEFKYFAENIKDVLLKT
jgi:hypothetical protein